MTTSRRKLSRLATALAVGLGGSTLFSACQTRVKEAILGGSQDLLAAALLSFDPNTVPCLFGAEQDAVGNSCDGT